MPGIYRLSGSVKHYDWGGTSFIPGLLQVQNSNNRPFAEYWVGAHANDTCRIELPDGKNVLLFDFISRHPDLLGPFVKKNFHHFPFLLKALDVRDMLSIQVHPAKKAAEKEYERENREGIPFDSPQRNYKDPNHKPELMVAMSDFWLLHGFKPANEIRHILQWIPEFRQFTVLFDQSGYEGLYKRVMEMPQQEVNSILQPLLNRIIPLYNTGDLNKSQEDFWAARAAVTFSHHGQADRGIFSIYFFNLLQLKKEEGIFQDAGVPHAYLEGQNIEIMASSDNVLRGGLTNKHIDVKELMKHVKCEATHPAILKGWEKDNRETVYPSPATEFQLSVFHLNKGDSVPIFSLGPEIFLLTSGHVSVGNATVSIELRPGHPSAIIFAGETATISALEPSVCFRACVPMHKS